MKTLNGLSLGRGQALLDFAHSQGETPRSFDLADLVGLVAAYIARGYPTHQMEESLSAQLGGGIAKDAVRTFKTFEDADGRGLWKQGPAVEDIVFTHAKLERYYPQVGDRWRATFDDQPLGEASLDVPF